MFTICKESISGWIPYLWLLFILICSKQNMLLIDHLFLKPYIYRGCLYICVFSLLFLFMVAIPHVNVSAELTCGIREFAVHNVMRPFCIRNMLLFYSFFRLAELHAYSKYRCTGISRPAWKIRFIGPKRILDCSIYTRARCNRDICIVEK